MAARKIGMKKISLNLSNLVATPLSATSIFATDFEVYVVAANAGANVYVGSSTVDNTWIPRAKGEIHNFVHGSGNMTTSEAVLAFDLSKIYAIADNNNDDIIVQYYAFED